MKKIYEKICKFEVYLAAFCFIVSCSIIFIAAIMRSFNKPLNWSMDVSLFLFAWSVFLSADVALRNDKLVNVDILINLFSRKKRDFVSLMNYIMIAIFLVTLFFYGIKLSYITRARSFQGIPGFSYTWVTLSVPCGAALQFVTVVLKLRNNLLRQRAIAEDRT